MSTNRSRYIVVRQDRLAPYLMDRDGAVNHWSSDAGEAQEFTSLREADKLARRSLMPAHVEVRRQA